jgi:KaiC/GvpD/RAD55 family RecA-like ATPase
VEQHGAGIGSDLSSHSANMYYLDSYSWSLRGVPKGKTARKNIVRITGPESLNEIIVKMERVMELVEGNVKMIVHSLSPFFLHNDDKEVVKFVQLLVTRVKEADSFILSALQEGVHSPSTVNTMKYLMDGTIEMRFHEGAQLQRQIRAHHMKNIDIESRWRPFKIGKKGFKIG